MSPEAQRIAIAEVRGWTGIQSSPGMATHPDVKWPRGYPPGRDKKDGWSEIPPIDLMTIHEAEKTLMDNKRAAYPIELLHCVWAPQIKLIPAAEGGWHSMTTHELPMLVCATAAQRAEAFLRLLNLWDDSK